MKQDVVIKVEGLSKQYSIGKRDSYLTLRDKLMELPNKLFKKEKKPTFWALKDVSFEVKRGEVLGVIGRNGAGKSTLLKILARITEPTTGKITMRGRVASMLEVGTGFNPELTGRENIYLNGSILGMSRSEIQSKFEEITDFAGIGKFLDTPVKHYSSGMYVRLAFAVAAHLDSDILLVDEVLAVGDAEFQKKCLGKMSDLAGGGKTVIFVSHNISAVQGLCNRLIWIENGSVKKIGANNLLREYSTINKNVLNKNSLLNTKNRQGNGWLRFTSVKITNETGIIGDVKSGDNVTFEISYKCINYDKLKNSNIIIFSFPLINSYGEKFSDFNTKITNYKVNINHPTGKIYCNIPRLPLAPGNYSITLYCSNGEILCDMVNHTYNFTVSPGSFFKSGNLPNVGWLLVDHTWEVK